MFCNPHFLAPRAGLEPSVVLGFQGRLGGYPIKPPAGVGGIPSGAFIHNAVLCEMGTSHAQRVAILHNAALCYLALPHIPLEGDA